MAQTTIQVAHLTALTSGLATTDEIIVSDAGVVKRMDISVIALSAAQLTSGTIPDARFPATLPAISGANLTNLPASGATLATSTNNQVVTVTGSNAMTGEANLTFDGTNLTVATGNVVIGTNGKGIDFSANTDDESGAGSLSSELLDDYEEGTWTPVIKDQPSGNSAGHAVQIGQYTKIGTQVFLSWTVQVNSISGMTTNYTAVVAGMPFTPRSTSNLTQVGSAIVQSANLGNDSGVVLQAVAGTAAMNTHQFDTNSGTTEVSVSEFGASGLMRGSISYPV